MGEWLGRVIALFVSTRSPDDHAPVGLCERKAWHILGVRWNASKLFFYSLRIWSCSHHVVKQGAVNPTNQLLIII